MDKLIRSGRYFFAIAFAAFGIQHFIYAKFAAGLGPPWIPGSPLRACFMGTALVVASIRIATNAKTRVTGMLLGFLLFLYFLLLYPRIVRCRLGFGRNPSKRGPMPFCYYADGIRYSTSALCALRRNPGALLDSRASFLGVRSRYRIYRGYFEYRYQHQSTLSGDLTGNHVLLMGVHSSFTQSRFCAP